MLKKSELCSSKNLTAILTLTGLKSGRNPSNNKIMTWPKKKNYLLDLVGSRMCLGGLGLLPL